MYGNKLFVILVPHIAASTTLNFRGRQLIFFDHHAKKTIRILSPFHKYFKFVTRGNGEEHAMFALSRRPTKIDTEFWSRTFWVNEVEKGSSDFVYIGVYFRHRLQRVLFFLEALKTSLLWKVNIYNIHWRKHYERLAQLANLFIHDCWDILPYFGKRKQVTSPKSELLMFPYFT